MTQLYVCICVCVCVYIGEGNGNPLQYSYLDNPMDRGAWWAAVRGVAQSQTRLNLLSMHACFGEGNGSPLQCSCLENPRDREFLANPKIQFSSVQFSRSVMSNRLFATLWTAACQASLSITNSRSLPKLMSIELVMPSNHLILCCLLLLPHSIFPSIRVYSNESILRIRWPKFQLHH